MIAVARSLRLFMRDSLMDFSCHFVITGVPLKIILFSWIDDFLYFRFIYIFTIYHNNACIYGLF